MEPWCSHNYAHMSLVALSLHLLNQMDKICHFILPNSFAIEVSMSKPYFSRSNLHYLSCNSCFDQTVAMTKEFVSKINPFVWMCTGRWWNGWCWLCSAIFTVFHSSIFISLKKTPFGSMQLCTYVIGTCYFLLSCWRRLQPCLKQDGLKTLHQMCLIPSKKKNQTNQTQV